MSGAARVVLFWLEPVPPGTAARTHFDGSRARLRAEGEQVGAEVYADTPSPRSKFARAARVLRLFAAVIRVSRPGDVVVCRFHVLVGLVTWLLRLRGRKIVLLVQGNGEAAFESNRWLRRIPGTRAVLRLGLRQADAAFVINEPLRELVRSAGLPDDKIHAISQGVAAVFFEARAAQGAGEDSDRYAVFFGNLAPWQGLETVLRATELPSWPQGLRLVVVGDGAQASMLATRSDSLVDWRGALPPEQLAPIVAGAMMTFCPKRATASMAEVTAPFKILESVAAGVPVIATDIPAQRRMLSAGGYGVVVPIDDPDALAKAARRLVQDDDLRYQLRDACDRIAPSLAWEVTGAGLVAVVRGLRELAS
ncbi:glycosyltransferase [Nocardioides sp. GY 10113]|uniref:glycosyltransferase n=1 Tax=Nocardioides sp. GY 10113 TaxID=2569761 RepID=UPI001458399A|nr:glycosyltransferase [Nocardioides sp. GY 10113]